MHLIEIKLITYKLINRPLFINTRMASQVSHHACYVFFQPLELILSSRLRAAGLISTIYVDFEPRGFYELNPNSEPIIGQQAFERLLRK